MRSRNRMALKLFSAASALLGLSLFSSAAQATPAFARQMDMNCMACHNQSVPMLNAFGRQFKLSSYTMTRGDAAMIDGGDLGMSLPLSISAGAGIKSQYLDTDKTGARDSISVPQGAAIMVSGKMAEGAGVNTLWNGDGLVHAQVSFSRPVGTGRAGMAYYGAMGHGAFIATEGYNTGLHKELQMFDNAARANAVQAMNMGLGKGPSTGLVAFYGGSGLTISGGIRALGFNSTFNNGGLDNDGGFGSQYRISYDLPTMGGWNMMLGAFGISGTTTGTTAKLFENTGAQFLAAPWAANVNNHEVTSSGFDMQLQGSIAGMDTQVIVAHVADYELQIRNEPDTMTMVNQDLSATSLAMQIMPSSAWGVRLGYMSAEDNLNSANDYTTLSYGVNYNYADNVRFSLEHSDIDNDTAADFGETLLTTIVAF